MSIRPMLACSDTILTDDNYDQIQYPIIASTKLDGWRAIITGDHNPQSRSGKTLPNVHTRKELKLAGLAGFDGELLASKPNDFNAMQKAQSAFSTIGGEPDFHYHIFDNWTREKEGFKSYLPKLKAMGTKLPSFASLIPQLIITSPEELADFVQDVTDEGYEGAIIRSLLSPYKNGRSTWNQGWMLKAKNYAYEEARIISLNEGMINLNPAQRDELGFSKRATIKGGKVPANTLGSFKVKNASGLEFSIGTGHLNANELKNIWDLRSTNETWVGKLITFKHFAGSGVKSKPRHGQFVSIRSLTDLS